jgi:O-antigen/teichoic acid export membrane protein
LTQINRIKKNSFFALLTHFIRLFANFFVFIGIARLYGPEEFGQFTAAHTLSTIFVLLADFGFDTLLVVEIARNKERVQQTINSYFSIKILLSLLATVLMIIVVSFETVSDTTKILMYLFSLYVLFSSFINFFFYLFRGYEEFHQETKISFIMNSFLLVIVIALSILHVSLFIIAAAFIGTRLLGIALAVKIAGNKFKWQEFRFSIVNKKEFLKINIYGLYGIFGTVLFTLDTILLSFLSNDFQVGLYQSVIKLASLGLLSSDILVYSILPSLTKYYSSDYSQWLKLTQYSHRTLIFVGTFISFFMIVFPADIITLVYGANRYNAAVPILRIFGCVIGIRYCSEAGGLILTSSHNQLKRLVVVIVATIFNLLANIYIIPRYGINGAAIISVLTNILVGIGYLYHARKYPNIWLLNIRQFIPFMVAILLGVIFWDGRFLNVWISFPLSAITIIAAVLIFGFNRVERYSLLNIKIWNVSKEF